MSERIDFAELKAAGKLPSPKGAALRVMHLCQEETVSMPDLARAIQNDPALAGRIIKIANYVNPNKSRPIAAVNTDALLLIGLHAVRQAAICMSLISNYREGPCKEFDYAHFWSLSVVMGSASQAVSQHNRIAPMAEMFNCGVMHGIGRLALATARPYAYGNLLERYRHAPREEILEAQRETFGLDDREMLVLLLQDWGIPKIFQEALYHHENPAASGFAADSRMQRLTRTLHLSSLLAEACMLEQVSNELTARIMQSGEELEIGADQMEDFIEQATENWLEWGAMLGVRTRRYAGPKLTWTDGQNSEKTGLPDSEAKPAVVPLHILVASSSAVQREQLEKFLSASGHTVASVDNGLSAHSAVMRSQPQAVISDWLMTGMDGVQLCGELRKAYAGKPLYFILLSPFEDERRRMEAYEAGVDDVMQTPINARLLGARLLAAQRAALSG